MNAVKGLLRTVAAARTAAAADPTSLLPVGRGAGEALGVSLGDPAVTNAIHAAIGDELSKTGRIDVRDGRRLALGDAVLPGGARVRLAAAGEMLFVGFQLSRDLGAVIDTISSSRVALREHIDCLGSGNLTELQAQVEAIVALASARNLDATERVPLHRGLSAGLRADAALFDAFGASSVRLDSVDLEDSGNVAWLALGIPGLKRYLLEGPRAAEGVLPEEAVDRNVPPTAAAVVRLMLGGHVVRGYNGGGETIWGEFASEQAAALAPLGFEAGAAMSNRDLRHPSHARAFTHHEGFSVEFILHHHLPGHGHRATRATRYHGPRGELSMDDVLAVLPAAPRLASDRLPDDEAALLALARPGRYDWNRELVCHDGAEWAIHTDAFGWVGGRGMARTWSQRPITDVAIARTKELQPW